MKPMLISAKANYYHDSILIKKNYSLTKKVHGLCCLHVHFDRATAKKKERIGYSNIHIKTNNKPISCIVDYDEVIHNFARNKF